jgi:dCMP deaminase
MNWNEYFMKIAHDVALKSKDPSTKVGCVIVGPGHEIRTTGFNGFPRGIDEVDEKRWERPVKYKYVEHAERNAIYNAARMGTELLDCTAYMTIPPCPDCARGLIQAGIETVVLTTVHPLKDREDWKAQLVFALSLLHEAAVMVVWTDL